MEYRLVRISVGGDAGRSVTADCESDDDAFARARLFAVGRAVEIWCGGKQVATLLPLAPPTAGGDRNLEAEPLPRRTFLSRIRNNIAK